MKNPNKPYMILDVTGHPGGAPPISGPYYAPSKKEAFNLFFITELGYMNQEDRKGTYKVFPIGKATKLSLINK